MKDATIATALVTCAIVACAAQVLAAEPSSLSWQEPHAKVLPSGDLEWAPTPYVFAPGPVVKYIDFEAGDDTGDGSKSKPWKHHPWDMNAAGTAKAFSGAATYVFKRGVVYRGKLMAHESGEPGNPIRLTCAPVSSSL